MKTTAEDVEKLYQVTGNAEENCVVADAATAVATLRLVRAYAIGRDDRALLALLDSVNGQVE